MHKSTEEFFNMFGPENRNDFYGGYLYLKYINRFTSIAFNDINLPTRNAGMRETRSIH